MEMNCDWPDCVNFPSTVCNLLKYFSDMCRSTQYDGFEREKREQI